MNSTPKCRARPSYLGPHDGRELSLMLAGMKHLSFFYCEVDADCFPEDQFDAAVAKGLLIKDERQEKMANPEGEGSIMLRNILYSTAAEAWRIPAMRLIQDIYARMAPGWRPDLERAIGALLGYADADVELFLERLSWIERPMPSADEGMG